MVALPVPSPSRFPSSARAKTSVACRHATSAKRRRSIQDLDANVAVAHRFAEEPVRLAAVHLQRDAAIVGKALLLVGPLHELLALDPGRDGRRVAFNARFQLVPFAMFPKLGPLLGRDGQGSRALVLTLDVSGDLVGALEEAVVAVVERADAFAVDPHEIAALVVVDHGLIR